MPRRFTVGVVILVVVVLGLILTKPLRGQRVESPRQPPPSTLSIENASGTGEPKTKDFGRVPLKSQMSLHRRVFSTEHRYVHARSSV